MPDRLKGRTAVVTGAASGMAEAIAKLFAAEGAKVLAVGRATQKIHDVCGGIDGITPFGKDVTELDAAEVIFAEAEAKLGGMDILVNGAGIGSGGSIEDLTEEGWQDVMNANLSSVFRLSKGAIPLLRKSKAGRIINIGSLMSEVGGPGMGGYPAAKHAVAGITKQMACELGPDGITVNYIIPGAIVTGMTKGLVDSDPVTVAYWEERTPLGRWGYPADIAPVALFLASDDAAFVTGAGIPADGGVLAAP